MEYELWQEVYVISDKQKTGFTPSYLSEDELLKSDFAVYKTTITSVTKTIEKGKLLFFYGVEHQSEQSFWGKMNPKYIFSSVKDAADALQCIINAQKALQKAKLDMVYTVKNLAGRFFY